jgi:two-component system response regulator ChvI
MSGTIALVDDNQNLLTTLSLALEDEGFTVRKYTQSTQALTSLSQKAADLLVLDIKMPRMDGMELLSRLRNNGSDGVPVIFLSSKDKEFDQVMGLRVGAEDYVTKPFSQTILVEKIRALLRFSRKSERSSEEKPISKGDLYVDPARRSCSWKDEEVELTRAEFEILRSLSSRPGIVKTRAQLLDVVHPDVYVEERTIDGHIKRIRRKFKKADSTFSNIKSSYGIGYCYREI